MKRVLIILMLTITAVFNSFSQEKISKQELIGDYNQFLRYLEETHPDPYSAYGGIIEFKRKAQDLRYAITDDMTVEEFRELLFGFISTLSDGHTIINSYNKEQKETSGKLPLKLKVAEDGIFIQNADIQYSAHIGAKILSINGESIESLLDKTQRIRPAENEFGAYNELSRLLAADNTSALILDSPEHLLLTVKTSAGNTESIPVNYVEEVAWKKSDSGIKLNKDNTLLYSQLLGNNKSKIGYFVWNDMYSREMVEHVAMNNPEYLSMNLDGMYKGLGKERPKDDKEAIEGIPSLYATFSGLLKEMKAQNSKYLIIDLRENGGGMTPLCLPLLYMLYGDDYLNYETKTQYNRRLSTLALKRRGLDDIEQFNKMYGTMYMRGDFVFDNFLGKHKPQPIEEKRKDMSLIAYFGGIGKEYTENLNGIPVYRPQVLVLTSPKTFSASYHFMYFLTEIDLNAKVIGVTPRQAGNTFMETTPFELPHTKISGSISNAAQIFFPDDAEKGKTHTPDYPMKWKDYAKYGFDENAEILYAIDIINNSLKE